jgi:hypothetical protein
MGDLAITNEKVTCDFIYRIHKHEVREALKRMRTKKAVGSDGMKSLEEIGVAWLTSLFNNICRVNKMAIEWRMSTLIHFYKNNRDVQGCTNYCGIKLISHTIKL